MTLSATVGEAVPLVLITEDGNEAQYPQAEIYVPGSTSPLIVLDLAHRAKGLYEASWTPSQVSVFTALFIVYSNSAHTVENTFYARSTEQVIVTENSVDDLALSILRLLGLSHENTFIDNTIFDSFGQLISARIRLFDSPPHVYGVSDGDSGVDGLIASYLMSADYEGMGRLKSYRYVRTV